MTRYDKMSTADVLAQIIGSNALASEVLARYGGLRDLDRAPPRDLVAVPGMGPSRAAKVKAAFELGRRAATERIEVGGPLRSPREVFEALGPVLRNEDREVFLVLGLDARNRVRLFREVAVGSLVRCIITPRDVFGPLLREAIAAAIVVHNHPSGDPTPSHEDLELTRRLKEAGDLLGVRLLDHLVIGAEGFVSLADRTLM